MDGESLTPEAETVNAGEAPVFDLPKVTENDGTVYLDEEETGQVEPESETFEENLHFEPSENESAEKYRGTLDDKGREYDPSLHVYPPEKTPSGIWKKIPKSQREKMNAGEIPQPASNAENRMAAQKAAGMYATAHMLGFGIENGAAESAEHFNQLVDGIEAYFNENGAMEIGATEMMLFSMVQYSAPIVQRKSNLEKVKIWGSKLNNFFKSFIPKKKVVKKDDEKKEPKGTSKEAKTSIV